MKKIMKGIVCKQNKHVICDPAISSCSVVFSKWNISKYNNMLSYVIEFAWTVIIPPRGKFDISLLEAVTWVYCSCKAVGWVGLRCSFMAVNWRRGSRRSVLSLRGRKCKALAQCLAQAQMVRGEVVVTLESTWGWPMGSVNFPPQGSYFQLMNEWYKKYLNEVSVFWLSRTPETPFQDFWEMYAFWSAVLVEDG